MHPKQQRVQRYLHEQALPELQYGPDLTNEQLEAIDALDKLIKRERLMLTTLTSKQESCHRDAKGLELKKRNLDSLRRKVAATARNSSATQAALVQEEMNLHWQKALLRCDEIRITELKNQVEQCRVGELTDSQGASTSAEQKEYLVGVRQLFRTYGAQFGSADAWQQLPESALATILQRLAASVETHEAVDLARLRAVHDEINNIGLSIMHWLMLLQSQLD